MKLEKMLTRQEWEEHWERVEKALAEDFPEGSFAVEEMIADRNSIYRWKVRFMLEFKDLPKLKELKNSNKYEVEPFIVSGEWREEFEGGGGIDFLIEVREKGEQNDTIRSN